MPFTLYGISKTQRIRALSPLSCVFITKESWFRTLSGKVWSYLGNKEKKEQDAVGDEHTPENICEDIWLKIF